ncbi:MAG: hypothetical protein H7249_10315 [Chitinophagaceae bacterium]|nr:hypothetical protein [Oligoflexus sp.]
MDIGFVKKRKLSNLLLEPLLQTQIGLYCIALSLIFSALIGIVIYENLDSLSNILFQLSDGKVTLQTVAAAYVTNIQAWLILCLIGYIVCTIGVSILYTHRLVGPTVAFRKHLAAIEKGNYHHRTVLRKNDAFQVVASQLNDVSALLLQNKQK